VAKPAGDLKALAEAPDRKGKAKQLVYDRRRDVLSLRDFMATPEDEAERVESRPQQRRKKVVQRSRRPMKTILTMPKEQKRVIRIDGDAIQVGELAHHMSVKGTEVVRKLMALGVMASVNQSIDFDTASVIANEFGFTCEKVGFDPAMYLDEQPDGDLDLKPRSPVVTIMGHVDHGKTTLLDRIRKSHVAEGEAGGITQHIGAYKVKAGNGDIVFLDTPGHEAFTAMRARGAKSTDIVILVVAADDGVMAQTKEAIAHAREANVPIIVAVNKIDKADARPERVRKELANEGILSEEWGGENIFCEISAKKGEGIEALLDAVLLQAEVLELKANPDKAGRGVVLESQLHPQLGPVATVLIQAGTLKVGDVAIAGLSHGRVRIMTDDQGKPVTSAGPSTPVRVAGLDMVPNAGDVFVVLPDERKAREIAEWQMEQIKRTRAASGPARVSLEDFYTMVQSGETKELKVVLRSDVQGSLGALTESVSKLKHPEIILKIIQAAVGNINESDVNLSIASSAVIVGFNVTVDPKAQSLADQEKIDIRRYSVIYDVIDDLRKAMEGLLTPKMVAKLIGRAEIRQVFSVSKVGKIAGAFVSFGHVIRSAEVRVIRGKETLFTGKLGSLKRFKDDAREVKQGLECGVAVDGFEGIEPGDTLEFYEYEQVRESLGV
jgi:translation initiation factor IF-2